MDIRFEPSRLPTKKETLLYKKWVKYLSDSRLSKEEITKRAKSFTIKGLKP